LKGAVFDKAALLEADFYGVDLNAARFDRSSLEATSFIRAKLAGARFDGANMRRVQNRFRAMPPTRFLNADLTGATFVDTCLGGADFTASNAEPAALARGFTEGIQIESEKLSQLGPLKSHDRCRAIQE
jgi:uncharacterized protein YjbI with pentapeptide repeats